MKRILLLVNPRARSGRERYQELSSALEQAGHAVVKLTPEDHQGDFRKIISSYADQIDLVILGGGDGTVNHVLPSLVSARVPLIIFPLGTANLLARSFNIKPNTQDLLELISTGEEVCIDLGVVNGIYFINVCGLGISTEVNQKLTPKLKKFAGPFSFWIKGFMLIRKLKPHKLKLSVDDNETFTTRSWQITICNGRKYAAWMTIEPRASYNDGILHCLSTEIKKWWQGFKLLPHYMKGHYLKDMEVHFLSAKKIRIETKRRMSIDVDGDVKTSTPAVFSIEPEVLKIILPKVCLRDESPISPPS